MGRKVASLFISTWIVVCGVAVAYGQGDESGTSWTSERLWFQAGYTTLWTNGTDLPPLVTTNDSIPPRPQAGVLGVGDTRVLLGGDQVHEGPRSGINMTLGGWLDNDQIWGAQVSWLYTGDPANNLDQTYSSLGSPVLARPFINAATGLQDSQLVAYPELVGGTLVASGTGNLQTVEAIALANLKRGSFGRLDLTAGYRYLRLQEGVTIEEHLVSTNPGGIVEIGTQIDVYDQFAAANQFHGGQLGLVTTLDRGWMTMGIAAKLAAGNVRRSVRVSGLTHVQTPDGGESTSSGGLLALASNMGTHEDDAFGLLPEFTLQTKFWLTDRLSFDVGYQLLFLTNVYRAGQQIDTTVDTSQLSHVLPLNGTNGAGQTRPMALLDSSTLRAQGFNLGFTFSY